LEDGGVNANITSGLAHGVSFGLRLYFPDSPLIPKGRELMARAEKA